MRMIDALFDWQKFVVEIAVKQGRMALFEDCGLGKTIQELEWSRQVVLHTSGRVLILAPLNVVMQTVAEGERFGITVTPIQDTSAIPDMGIFICNYDRFDKLDASLFVGIVLDESSILKSFQGKTRIALTEAFRHTPYRLCGTATPSPNDPTELGQHAEFLGVCTSAQMLATWFINDTFDTGEWRLKRHSVGKFWEWVSTWAICISKPSDIGFSDDGYTLPPLNMETIVVEVDQVNGRDDDQLFRMTTMSATTINKEKKHTLTARVEALAGVVNSCDEQWAVWCSTNDEADALVAAIPDAVEVRGDHKPEFKVQAGADFISGKIRVIISKSRIFGYGSNWQHCHNTAFVGLSYSFEDLYQALRRFYRFGQKLPVRAVIVQAETEGAILETIKVKIAAHDGMRAEMKIAAQALRATNDHEIKMKTDINTVAETNWTIHHGDCVRVAKEMEDESIHFSVFSPPFADLFTYSNDEQDMGNCGGVEEFMEQFKFLVDELYRVTMPGRESAVHCLDLLSTKWKHGAIELQNFSGVIVDAFRARGWLFHSRITIWKDPVTEMQRTKAHGLLYKTLKSDSSKSRVGCPEYLLIFKKPGENPEPITHTEQDFPLDLWQEIASPVWMTIDQGNVLNKDGARDEKDERHICPLQLDVIDRALLMWSNPGDLVFSPFTGIGSEGVRSLVKGRKFIGSELKESYFKQAVQNLKNATVQPEFSLI